MNRDEYVRLFHKLELNLVAFKRLMDCDEEVLKLVNAAIAAEREKVAAWMMQRGYATGHGDTTEDLLSELEWQVRESEREACAKVCDVLADKHTFEGGYANECAIAIRERGAP
jgi:hypothetical protein